MPTSDAWVRKIENRMNAFASRHGLVFSASARQVSASFEIGCFHALCDFYSVSCALIPEGLTAGNEYRYLTSPSGNPNNFSYVRMVHASGEFELRQQVRIRSHLHSDIAFTPDLVVVRSGAAILSEKDGDYASGKRAFYCVTSDDVIAAHECKSLNPFPELLVGFLGMLIAAHKWLESPTDRAQIVEDGLHLAPSLFVGGTARALHVRMVKALEQCYPINIVLGLHVGTWSLLGGRRLNLLPALGSLSVTVSTTEIETTA